MLRDAELGLLDPIPQVVLFLDAPVSRRTGRRDGPGSVPPVHHRASDRRAAGAGTGHRDDADGGFRRRERRVTCDRDRPGGVFTRVETAWACRCRGRDDWRSTGPAAWPPCSRWHRTCSEAVRPGPRITRLAQHPSGGGRAQAFRISPVKQATYEALSAQSCRLRFQFRKKMRHDGVFLPAAPSRREIASESSESITKIEPGPLAKAPCDPATGVWRIPGAHQNRMVGYENPGCRR